MTEKIIINSHILTVLLCFGFVSTVFFWPIIKKQWRTMIFIQGTSLFFPFFHFNLKACKHIYMRFSGAK